MLRNRGIWSIFKGGQALNDDGLVVVGLYHHKSPSPLYLEDVATLAQNMGFNFPIGIDPDWSTLRRWWLDPVPDAKFTSVSFLVDHQGIIRHIHPGGDYVMGDDDHTAMQAAIEEQLQRVEGQQGRRERTTAISWTMFF